MKKILILLILFSGCVGQAWAARPFVTDDARLTTAGSCQLESWIRNYSASHEVWALPACNPLGNFEVTLGGGVSRNLEQRSTTDYILQAKTLLRPLSTNDWGIGMAAGMVRHPDVNPGPNLLGNTYAYIPASISLADDYIVLHGNLGWLRDHATHLDNATWGVGGELQLQPHLIAIAETFGDHRNQPYWQVGTRYAVRPGVVQVDATFGRQFNGMSGWFSFGLRLTPARMF